MAVVVIDECLASMLRREVPVTVREHLHSGPKFGSAIYRRWMLVDVGARPHSRLCVHSRRILDSCGACWTLDRAHMEGWDHPVLLGCQPRG